VTEPAAPPVPQPPAGPIATVEGWFRKDAEPDLATLARSHAPAIFRLVAALAEKAEADPEVKALMPEALDALMSAARMAAAAL